MATKRSSWLKWVVILGLVAVVAGAGFWFFGAGDNSTPQYQSASVPRGEIIQAATATGTLNPVVNVQVGSQISGIIQNLYADFNSSVKSNQDIARLDPATYQANVHSAEGDLANARAQLELAQVEARRAEALDKDKLVSQSEYDQTMAS